MLSWRPIPAPDLTNWTPYRFGYPIARGNASAARTERSANNRDQPVAEFLGDLPPNLRRRLRTPFEHDVVLARVLDHF